MTVGTVAYAAPEQLMGQALDGRADQYALAASAFHLITGRQLFQHDNPAVVISNHLTASRPPSVIAFQSSRGWALRSIARCPSRPPTASTRAATSLRRWPTACPRRRRAGRHDPTMAASMSGKRKKPAKKDESGSRRLRLTLLGAGDRRGARRRGDCVGWPSRTARSPLLSVRRRRRRRVLRPSRWFGSVPIATPSALPVSRRAVSRRTARDRPPTINFGRFIRDPCRSASDGRARPYRRGVSGRHRGTGAGVRESNGEDRAECRNDIREGNLSGPA